MKPSLGKLFKFYKELNVVKLLQNLWSFTDVTSKYVFKDQNKTIISVTSQLLKK